MSLDEFMKFVCVAASIVLAAIMATLGYFFPFAAVTPVIFLIGMSAMLIDHTKGDVAWSAAMFLIAPLIGTAFKEPGLNLGQYEGLFGAWVAAFLAGYVTAYYLQQRRTKPGKPATLITTVH
jgi:hypothetical protein